MTNSTRLAFVDDHPLMRDGFANSLQQASDFMLIGTGESTADALRIANELSPEIMIIGVNNWNDGISATKSITHSHPEIKLVLLTAFDGEHEVLDALSSGVKGYILKGVIGADLVAILQSVSRGETYVTPSLAVRLLSKPRQSQPQRKKSALGRTDELTARQVCVLEALARGLSNKEIARELSLSTKAVKHGVGAILAKLGVRNRTEAALVSGRISSRELFKFSNVVQMYSRRH